MFIFSGVYLNYAKSLTARKPTQKFTEPSNRKLQETKTKTTSKAEDKTERGRYEKLNLTLKITSGLSGLVLFRKVSSKSLFLFVLLNLNLNSWFEGNDVRSTIVVIQKGKTSQVFYCYTEETFINK